MLHHLCMDADACCLRAFTRLGLAGKLDTMTVFECPKCGQEYKPQQEGAIVNWQAACWMARL